MMLINLVLLFYALYVCGTLMNVCICIDKFSYSYYCVRLIGLNILLVFSFL
jgi:hypothetical protein